MCDNVQSHSLSPNVCFLRVRGTGAYDLKDRMQGRFTGVTLMEHLRAGIIRHSRDVLMVARSIAHGLNNRSIGAWPDSRPMTPSHINTEVECGDLRGRGT